MQIRIDEKLAIDLFFNKTPELLKNEIYLKSILRTSTEIFSSKLL